MTRSHEDKYDSSNQEDHSLSVRSLHTKHVDSGECNLNRSTEPSTMVVGQLMFGCGRKETCCPEASGECLGVHFPSSEEEQLPFCLSHLLSVVEGDLSSHLQHEK